MPHTMRSRPPHSFCRDGGTHRAHLTFARELVCLVSEKRTNISSEADHDDVGVIDAMLFEKGDKLFTRIARRQENLKGLFEFISAIAELTCIQSNIAGILVFFRRIHRNVPVGDLFADIIFESAEEDHLCALKMRS